MSIERSKSIQLFRVIAVAGLLISALASLGLTLYEGRYNKSHLLIAMFVVWVLSPFLALFLLNRFSGRCSSQALMVLYALMLFLSLVSVLSYSGVWRSPEMKPAFLFLIVPLVSWFLIVVIIPLSRKFLK